MVDYFDSYNQLTQTTIKNSIAMYKYDVITGESFSSSGPFCKKGDTLKIKFKGKKVNAKVLRCNNSYADIGYNGRKEMVSRAEVIKVLW